MYNLNLQKIIMAKTKIVEFSSKLKYFNIFIDHTNKNEKGL